MPEVTQLTLAVDSRQVKTAAGDLDNLSRAGKSAEKEAGSLARAYQSVGRVFGAVAASVLAREVIQAADAYKNMNARLQLVTSSMAELASAQQGVFDISQKTRIGLGETTDLFTSLARSTKTLGVSQEELLGVTQSINQALVVSGTSAQSASAALVQLGQGFASGVLRGEELNSVLEQAPRLAQAIADGMGVPLGQLRALGQEGKLTAEKVFEALQKSGTALNEEFAKMPLTVSQATTQAGTSLSRLIGYIDGATGATGSLALAISGAARGIDVFVNRFSDSMIVRAQAEVDTLRQRLQIMMLSNSAEHPMVKLLQKQLDDATATLKNLKADLSTNQSAAETSRLARSRPTTAIGPDLSTISGIETRLKELKKLREDAELGSADFKRYTSEIKSFEEQLKKINPSGRAVREKASEVFLSYQDQIKQRVASIFENSDVIQAQKYMDALKELDNLYFDAGISAELYDSAVKNLTGSTSSAQEQTSRFIAEQERLAELLAGTESAGIEKQREDMQLLTQALIEGRIKEGEYLEAVGARLGLVAEKTKEAKSFADELGLSFASAFEDAALSGGKLSDVLKGLAEDVARLILRQQVTKPLANAVGGINWGSLLSSLLGGGTSSAGAGAGWMDSLFVPSAKGNVFGNAPALSAYSGSIVDRPTLFPFARGAGLMGEAGPEAILPLSRGKDGKLGVASGGGSKVTLNVINQTGAQVDAKQSRQTMPDGSQLIELILTAAGDAVANRSGPLARGLESGYGIRPRMD